MQYALLVFMLEAYHGLTKTCASYYVIIYMYVQSVTYKDGVCKCPRAVSLKVYHMVVDWDLCCFKLMYCQLSVLFCT